MATGTALKLIRTQTAEEDLRDPVRLYLSTLSASGRRTMDSKLRTLQRLLNLKKLEPNDLPLIALAGRAALQEAHAAPATINATISALKGVARAAWQTGLISAEEFQRVRDLRSVRGSRLPSGRSHTKEEVEALVIACVNDRSPAGVRDATIVALQYCLGLRRSECVSLDLVDYSSPDQTIRVLGKGDKQRLAHLVDPGSLTVLSDWLRRRGRDAGPLLCPVTRYGTIVMRRLTDQAIYNALRKRARAAGITNLTPHNLRRSCGTDLLTRGVDVIVVKKILGHSRLETTERYDHRGDSAQRRAAGMLTLPYRDQLQPELPWGEPQTRKRPVSLPGVSSQTSQVSSVKLHAESRLQASTMSTNDNLPKGEFK